MNKDEATRHAADLARIFGELFVVYQVDGEYTTMTLVYYRSHKSLLADISDVFSVLPSGQVVSLSER